MKCQRSRYTTHIAHTNPYKIYNKYLRIYQARIMILICSLSHPKYFILFCILPGQIRDWHIGLLKPIYQCASSVLCKKKALLYRHTCHRFQSSATTTVASIQCICSNVNWICCNVIICQYNGDRFWVMLSH